MRAPAALLAFLLLGCGSVSADPPDAATGGQGSNGDQGGTSGELGQGGVNGSGQAGTNGGAAGGQAGTNGGAAGELGGQAGAAGGPCAALCSSDIVETFAAHQLLKLAPGSCYAITTTTQGYVPSFEGYHTEFEINGTAYNGSGWTGPPAPIAGGYCVLVPSAAASDATVEVM